MSRRATLALGVVTALAVLLAVPAAACHKHNRTVERQFALNIPAPLLSYTHTQDLVSCADRGGAFLATSHHVEEFVAPAAGRLRVEVTDFLGDWDVVLLRDTEVVAEGGPTRTPLRMSDGSVVEVLEYTFAAAGPSEIVVCNFLGGPQGNAKLVFTYAR